MDAVEIVHHDGIAGVAAWFGQRPFRHGIFGDHPRQIVLFPQAACKFRPLFGRHVLAGIVETLEDGIESLVDPAGSDHGRRVIENRQTGQRVPAIDSLLRVGESLHWITLLSANLADVFGFFPQPFRLHSDERSPGVEQLMPRKTILGRVRRRSRTSEWACVPMLA
jgi:hypothetical protein